jgi:hypothetical protein
MSSPDSQSSPARMYALVVLCEIAVIAALWLFGRIYS